MIITFAKYLVASLVMLRYVICKCNVYVYAFASV